MGVLLNCCLNKTTKEGLARIFSGSCGGLKYHGAIHLMGCLHDGVNLLHIVNVKSRQSVAMLGCVVKELS
jgi:hypothetical protein